MPARPFVIVSRIKKARLRQVRYCAPLPIGGKHSIPELCLWSRAFISRSA